MFLERRLERLIERLKESASIPLRLELWNGRAFDLASHPTVKIGVPSPSAPRFLISPDLMKLGQAYVEGTLRVEGPILEVFRVAESLARGAASRGDGSQLPLPGRRKGGSTPRPYPWQGHRLGPEGGRR